MDDTGVIKNRRVIPRWRELKDTVPAELRSAAGLQPKAPLSDDLLNNEYIKWQENPTLENAFDVLCVAQLSKEQALAYGPAEQILKEKNVKPEAQKLAETIRRGKRPSVIEFDSSVNISPEVIKKENELKIRQAKLRLKDEPRNGLLWLDLARFQLNVGNTEKAKDAMRIAMASAPSSRLVLRGAVNFWTHQEKYDEAHDVVKSSDLLETDPWIQAAEIAAASKAERKPKSIKKGMRAVDDGNFSLIHISELAASIGTEEWKSGNSKAAKKLLRKGLLQPTENAVAQAIWLNTDLNMEIDPQGLGVAKAYEARTATALNTDDYEEAVRNCLLWCLDEPYSPVPTVQGSFISSTFLGDDKTALKFYEIAKLSNNLNFNIINNAAVACAHVGDLVCARTLLSQIYPKVRHPVATATAGLIEFRAGNVSEGRRLYEKALDEAVELKSADIEFRARVHWLSEEIAAESIPSSIVDKVIKSLDTVVEDHKDQLPALAIKFWNVEKARISTTKLKSEGHVSLPRLIQEK